MITTQDAWTIRWQPAKPGTRTSQRWIDTNDVVAIHRLAESRTIESYPCADAVGHATVHVHPCADHLNTPGDTLRAGDTTAGGTLDWNSITSRLLGHTQQVACVSALCDGYNVHFTFCTENGCAGQTRDTHWYHL